MYIDPSTGGMLFQVLAVLFGVISGSVLLFSSRIKMFFAKMRRNASEESLLEEDDDEDILEE